MRITYSEPIDGSILRERERTVFDESETRNLCFRMPNGPVSGIRCDGDALRWRESEIVVLKGFENVCWPQPGGLSISSEDEESKGISWLRLICLEWLDPDRLHQELVEEMEVKLATMISCSKVPVALHSQIAVTLPGSDHLRVGSSGAPKVLSCHFFLTNP